MDIISKSCRWQVFICILSNSFFNKIINKKIQSYYENNEKLKLPQLHFCKINNYNKFYNFDYRINFYKEYDSFRSALRRCLRHHFYYWVPERRKKVYTLLPILLREHIARGAYKNASQLEGVL